MQTNHEFTPSSDRYAFDLKLCHFEKGWAQLDTCKDASYYGNWINPTTRQLCSFAEGDVTVITCDNDAEFITEVTSTVEWHEANGYKPAIDGMCSASIIARFPELGLAHLLH